MLLARIVFTENYYPLEREEKKELIRDFIKGNKTGLFEFLRARPLSLLA